ncbi:Wadjet anti-phage system protein JetD domain-containing protein [Dietzia cercidiphylli]|uniref:Wadjet anti-phage system protein JetD domain-containing protein n=2 Tax=Dietzia TaxID=37914 RepID=UPI0035CCCF0D
MGRGGQDRGVAMRFSIAVVVENEVTYLTLPVPADGVVIWGKGFDVARLGRWAVLQDAEVHYWDDLDTHGFAILHRLRAHLPQTRSFLMDAETLHAHRDRWGRENAPTSAALGRLSAKEAAVYDDLVSDRFGDQVRLEQERINWAWTLDQLPYDGPG